MDNTMVIAVILLRMITKNLVNFNCTKIHKETLYIYILKHCIRTDSPVEQS